MIVLELRGVAVVVLVVALADELGTIENGRYAALGERLAGIHDAVGADSEIFAHEGRPEEFRKPVHEPRRERRLALSVAADAFINLERPAEGAQKLRADCIVGVLGAGHAEYLADPAIIRVLLYDSATAGDVGDGVVVGA